MSGGTLVVVRALLVLGLTGCLHEIRAAPLDLEAARQPVLANQPARITSKEDGIVELGARDTIEVVTAHGERFRLGLGQLMHDCPDHAAEANRLCELHDIDHVVIGHRRDYKTPLRATAAAAVLLGVLGASGAMVYCAADCDRETPRRLSQIGTGALIGLVLYAVFSHPNR